MLQKPVCKKLKKSTLKQSIKSTPINFETYDADTKIDNEVEIADDNYLK